MKESFLIRLDYARTLAGVPFHINSGSRCETHNKSREVGGSATSSHLVGWAADIRVLTDYEYFRVLASLLSVGFKRIGLGETFIHVDRDPIKNPERTWTY
jgi:uncharacterized protein YcbK (DUF882 family)